MHCIAFPHHLAHSIHAADLYIKPIVFAINIALNIALHSFSCHSFGATHRLPRQPPRRPRRRAQRLQPPRQRRARDRLQGSTQALQRLPTTSESSLHQRVGGTLPGSASVEHLEAERPHLDLSTQQPSASRPAARQPWMKPPCSVLWRRRSAQRKPRAHSPSRLSASRIFQSSTRRM